MTCLRALLGLALLAGMASAARADRTTAGELAALKQRARAALAGGRVEEGLKAWRDAIRRSPGFADSEGELAQALIKLGRYVEAERLLAHPHRTSFDFEVRFARAQLALARKQSAAAQKGLLDAMRRTLDEGQFERAAQALFALGVPGTKEPALKAPATGPADPERWLALGRHLLRAGQAAGAATAMRLARRKFPQDPAVAAAVAHVDDTRGQWRQAATSYKRAHELAPERPELAVRAAEIEVRRLRPLSALDALDSIETPAAKALRARILRGFEYPADAPPPLEHARATRAALERTKDLEPDLTWWPARAAKFDFSVASVTASDASTATLAGRTSAHVWFGKQPWPAGWRPPDEHAVPAKPAAPTAAESELAAALRRRFPGADPIVRLAPTAAREVTVHGPLSPTRWLALRARLNAGESFDQLAELVATLAAGVTADTLPASARPLGELPRDRAFPWRAVRLSGWQRLEGHPLAIFTLESRADDAANHAAHDWLRDVDDRRYHGPTSVAHAKATWIAGLPALRDRVSGPYGGHGEMLTVWVGRHVLRFEAPAATEGLLDPAMRRLITRVFGRGLKAQAASSPPTRRAP